MYKLSFAVSLLTGLKLVRYLLNWSTRIGFKLLSIGKDQLSWIMSLLCIFKRIAIFAVSCLVWGFFSSYAFKPQLYFDDYFLWLQILEAEASRDVQSKSSRKKELFKQGSILGDYFPGSRYIPCRKIFIKLWQNKYRSISNVTFQIYQNQSTWAVTWKRKTKTIYTM